MNPHIRHLHSQPGYGFIIAQIGALIAHLSGLETFGESTPHVSTLPPLMVPTEKPANQPNPQPWHYLW